MARGKRFSFICGSSSAASQPTRPSSGDTAPQEDKMPTSQPMQRSTESLWSADTGSSYVESDSSNLSDASTRSDVSDTPTYPCPPYSRLHDPPSPDDASLLHMAILLSKAIPAPPDCNPFSPPPLEEDAQFLYPLRDPYMTDEEYDSHITIMGIREIARRASLPLETFILAALILKRLEPVAEKFYDDWVYELRKARVREDDRCKEVVVLSAIIIAQKFLHDAIYILSTWTDMVCEGREDLHYYNLSVTERLILRHIGWRVSLIADPKEIERHYTVAVNSQYSDYPDFCYAVDDDERYDDCDPNISPL